MAGQFRANAVVIWGRKMVTRKPDCSVAADPYDALPYIHFAVSLYSRELFLFPALSALFGAEDPYGTE
jgi:hypothetical protein